MSHILPLLNEMRGRLGMYIGTSSLTKLAAFLRGYDYAVEKCSGKKTDPFLGEFRDWVHNRFQSTSQSWEDTILSHSADEADAVERFWELLGEYLKENSQAKLPGGNSDGVPGDSNKPPSDPLQLTRPS